MSNNKDLMIDIDERVPKSAKVAFGFANAGVGLLSGIINGGLSAFYNIKLGLEPGKIATAMLIFAIWNALNDPIFGILEDRTNTRIGRRIPYLRYGAPVFGVMFMLSWFPFLQYIFNASANIEQWALFANFLIVLFLLDTMFTLVGLVTYSLPSEMAITAKGRAKVQVYGVYLGAIGTLGSLLIPTFFITTSTSVVTLYVVMGITSIVGALLLFVSSFFLVENEYAMREEKLSFWKSIITCFSYKTFWLYEFSNFFYQIAWVIISGLISVYIRYELELSGIMSFIPIVIIFLMVLTFTYPASLIIKKWGVKKTYLIAAGVSIPILVVMYFVSSINILAMIVLGLFGVMVAAMTLSNSPMFFEIIDKDELENGTRRETSFSGMNALFTKPAISIANAIFFAIIGAFGYITPTEAIPDPVQPTSAISAITFATTIIPAIALGVSIIFIAFFDLVGPEWEAQKAKLAEIHIQKERAYIQKLAEEGKISETYKKLYKS
ncbi:MAG: hypothetical protein EU530_09945 [Promethearchaeota archaeon]|nr:MAG: hypothetical protein EU530_09945 [Candidatus Lokiarchaeota archaeon]